MEALPDLSRMIPGRPSSYRFTRHKELASFMSSIGWSQLDRTTFKRAVDDDFSVVFLTNSTKRSNSIKPQFIICSKALKAHISQLQQGQPDDGFLSDMVWGCIPKPHPAGRRMLGERTGYYSRYADDDYDQLVKDLPDFCDYALAHASIEGLLEMLVLHESDEGELTRPLLVVIYLAMGDQDSARAALRRLRKAFLPSALAREFPGLNAWELENLPPA